MKVRFEFQTQAQLEDAIFVLQDEDHRGLIVDRGRLVVDMITDQFTALIYAESKIGTYGFTPRKVRIFSA